VYTVVVALMLALVAAPALAETTPSFDRTMARGPADAPVTIFEFSDYQ
jgi:hypothetical protein